MNHLTLSTFILSVAYLLRGEKQSNQGKVILPFVVLGRLDLIFLFGPAQLYEAENALRFMTNVRL